MQGCVRKCTVSLPESPVGWAARHFSWAGWRTMCMSGSSGKCVLTVASDASRLPSRSLVPPSWCVLEAKGCDTGGEQACCRYGKLLTGDIRDGMGKRRRAPHSKAAAAARNSRFPDHARQPVRQPPVGRKRPSGSLPFPGTTAPTAARRDALECGALRRFPSRVAKAEAHAC